MKQPKVIGIIPARLRSTRLPNKMVHRIFGKPLVLWTYENAMKCPIFEKVIIATDSEEIYNICKASKANVVMTSPHHQSGSDRCAEVVENDIDIADSDIIVNIQGDEPEVSQITLQKTISALINDPQAQVSTPCIRINNDHDAKNSSNVKCVFDLHGYALYFSRAMIPFGKMGEFNPDVSYFKHFGIYAFRKNCLMHSSKTLPTPLQIAEDLEQLKLLELGYRIRIVEVQEDSVGIDTQQDLEKFIQTRIT